MLKKQKHCLPGFTLVEMIVVIFVTGIVGIALNSLIVNFYRSNAYLLQQTSAIDSAHRGLETSFVDLREASYGDDGSYPILSAATSSVIFFSDINGDGSVEKVRLYLQSGTFYRGVTNSTSSPPVYTGQSEATTTIATYVRNASSTPLFRYYGVDGIELSATSTVDVSKISSVSTSVMVDLNPLRAPDILTLQATATLRNLRQ
ncbi:MAG: prepilin-type N-terminal cleavage/methylation domain-containing protein [Patescibacteria group bacterium]